MLLIRYPAVDVLADLLSLAEQMHADSQYAHIPFDAIAMTDVLSHSFCYTQTHYVAAVIKEGKTVAGMIGLIEPYLFNRQYYVARDIGLFVTPNQRNAVFAKALINDFEDWAKQRGASDVVLGATAAVDFERTTDFYQRLGYSKFGCLSRKGV